MGSARRVMIFTGPSGGHLFPALAFAEAYRKMQPEVDLTLVTSRRAQAFVPRMSAGIFDRVFWLPDFPFMPGSALRTLGFLLKLPRAFWLSWNFLRKIKPELSLGFGSYASYPGLFLSARMGIPTLIHEQNVLPGRATRALAPHVDCVAVSFPATDTGKKCRRREITGLPLRETLIPDGVSEASGHDSFFRLLVLGGSQGSQRLNRAVMECFSLLTLDERRKIAVKHITGQADYSWVSQAYAGLGMASETYPFFESIQCLYREADLAITRGGANTLFELALHKLPAIIVPYPYAGAHQSANADFFRSRHAAIFQSEEHLTGEWLSEKLKSLKNNLKELAGMAAEMEKLADGKAAGRLVSLADQLVEQKS